MELQTMKPQDLESAVNRLYGVKVTTVFRGTATAYFDRLEFFISDAAGLKSGDKVYVMPTHVEDGCIHAVESGKQLENLSKVISKYEAIFSLFTKKLPSKDSPYFKLGSIINRFLDQEISLTLSRYLNSSDILSDDYRAKINSYRRRHNELSLNLRALLSNIDEAQKLMGMEDENFFNKDITAEVIEHPIAEEGYEIIAMLGDDFSVVMTPSGTNSAGLPTYDFPNYFIGQRNIHLTHVDKDGIFYCIVSEPPMEEVRKYVNDLKKRSDRGGDSKYMMVLLAEACSITNYFHKKRQKYGPKIAEQALELSQSNADMCAILLAEENGRIVSVTENNIHYIPVGIDVHTKEHLIDPRANYMMLTYTDEEREKSLVVFFAAFDEVHGVQERVIKPTLMPAFHQKQALTALANEIAKNYIINTVNLYFKSTVKLAHTADNISYKGTIHDSQLGKAYLYKF